MSKRKTIPLLLVLALCLCLFPVSALAADSDFTIEGGILTKYNGPGGDVVIPPDVTRIGGGVFWGCTSLTSVTIPNSVTRIDQGAFYGCTSLTSMTIPSSVATIDGGAFTGCTGLTNVTIPDSVTMIGWEAFRDCTCLTSVTIPNSVTRIGQGAFRGCKSLTSVTIGSGITSIVFGAFEDCTGLTSVTIPDSVTEIGYYAFLGCDGLKSVTISNSVTSIEEKAFYRCTDLTDVHFTGNEAQWEAIAIYDYNDPLKKATIHYNSPMPEQLTPTPTASPSPQAVLVDGRNVDFAMYAVNDGATNYIRIRDLAVVLNGTAAQFGVGYDETTESVTLTSKTAYQGTTDKAPFTTDMAYTDYTKPTYVDGKAVQLEAIQIEYNGGGYTYYKLRDLGQALGFNVGYDKATDTVYIETDKPYDHSN